MEGRRGRSQAASFPIRARDSAQISSAPSQERIDHLRTTLRSGVLSLVRLESSHTEASAGGLCDDGFGAHRPTRKDVAAAEAAVSARSTDRSGRSSTDRSGRSSGRHSSLLSSHPEGEEAEEAIPRSSSAATEGAASSVGSAEGEQLQSWLATRMGTKRQFLLISLFIAADAARFSVYEGEMWKINPATMLVTLNITSLLLSALIAVAMEGGEGWAKLWTVSRFGRAMLPAALFAVSQLLIAYAFHVGISASQNATLGFIYLPFAMFQAVGVFNREYGRLEWLSMAMLTVSVATFVLVLEQGRQLPGEGFGKPGVGIFDSSTKADGVFYVCTSAIVSAMGSTLMERQMKDWRNTERQRVGDRFYIHKFHLDMGAALVSVAIWFMPTGEKFEVSFFDLAWWEDLPLVLVALAQSWLAALVARHFSTVAKAVAQTITVVVVFFALARGPNHERHILTGARYTFCTASVCLGAIVIVSAAVFQTGRINMDELKPLERAAGSFSSDTPTSSRRSMAVRATIVAPPVNDPARQASSDNVLKYSLLLLLIAAEAGRELMRQWALGGSSNIVFQSVTVMNCTCSIAIATMMAGFSDGFEGVKMAWDIRRIVKCSVVAIFFSLAATLGNMAYVYGITATVSTILGYSYMPLSAIVSRWVLNRYYMWLEWFALIIVTLASIAYAMLETYAKNAKQEADGQSGGGGGSSSSSIAMGMQLASVVLSVMGSLVSEKILKGERLPFCIQKVHLEGGSLAVAVGVLFFMPFITQRRVDKVWCARPLDATCMAANSACMQEPDFCQNPECSCDCGAGLLVGWNVRIVLLLIINMSHAWIGGLVAKYTSTVHKGVAQCCALLVIYVGGRTLMPQSSGPSSTAMTMVTLIVPLSVVLFQVAAAEMQQVWQAKAARLQNESESFDEASNNGAAAEVPAEQPPQDVEMVERVERRQSA